MSLQRLWKCALGAALAALLLGALPAAAQDLKTVDELIAGQPRAAAAGRVVDKDGKPVANAEVFACLCGTYQRLRDRLAGKTTTDAEGKWRIEDCILWEPDLPNTEGRSSQEYAFVARHPELGIEFAILLKDDNPEDITITLVEPTTYDVILKDEDGTPVPGAKVYLHGGEHHAAIKDRFEGQHVGLGLNVDIGVSSGETDENGKVTLVGVPPGRFWYEKDGYVRMWGRDEMQFFPAVTVTGKVTLEDGTPMPGAIVTYVYHGQNLYHDQSVMADEKGNYRIANAPGAGFSLWWTGEETIRAEKEGGGSAEISASDARIGSPYLGKAESLPCTPGSTQEMNLVLSRACEVTGTVTNLADGKPAAGVKANLYIQGDGPYLKSNPFTTDENGAFKVMVAPGSNVQVQWEEAYQEGGYLIDQEWRNQGNWQPYRGVITEDTKLDLNIKLLPVYEVRGRVVDPDGKPVEEAEVWVHSEVPCAKTDAGGAFTLPTVPSGRDISLFAISKDKKLAALHALERGAAEAAIALEPTRDYKGMAADAEGVPASNLKFYLDLHLNDTNVWRVREEPKTNDKGEFRVQNLCPDATYYAWWSADNEENRDYDYGNATIDLTKVAEGDPIAFEAMLYLNVLMGRIVNEQGEPVANASIETMPWQIRPQSNREAVKTNDNGEFEIPRMAGGEAELRVIAPEYRPGTFKIATDTLDFVGVLRAKSAEGTIYDVSVTDEAGKPVANAPLEFNATYHKQGEPEPRDETRTAAADADGKAEFIVKTAENEYGQGVITCDLPGHCLSRAGFNTREDATIMLVVHPEGERWSARVLDEKRQPIAGAKVQLTWVSQGSGQNYRQNAILRDKSGDASETDADGRFEIARVSKADSVGFRISASGYASVEQSFSADPARPQPAEFTLMPGGTVKGKVVEKATGRPLKSARVYLMDVNQRMHRECDMGEDGTFSCDGLAAGRYDFICGLADETLRHLVLAKKPECDVIPGETVEVTIEFEEGTLVSGRVVDPATGKAPEKVHIAARDVHTNIQAGAKVEDDGTWSLYAAPGDYTIACFIEGQNRQIECGTLKVVKGKPIKDFVIEVKPAEPEVAAAN